MLVGWLNAVHTHTHRPCHRFSSHFAYPVRSFTFSKVFFRIQSEINWIYFWPWIGFRNVHFEKFPIRLIAVIILFPWHFHRLIPWLSKFSLFGVYKSMESIQCINVEWRQTTTTVDCSRVLLAVTKIIDVDCIYFWVFSLSAIHSLASFSFLCQFESISYWKPSWAFIDTIAASVVAVVSINGAILWWVFMEAAAYDQNKFTESFSSWNQAERITMLM